MSVPCRYCQIATDTCKTPLYESSEKEQIFSAYSSHDPEIVNQIEGTIKELNGNSDIRWVSWSQDMEIENQIIFCEICKYIYLSKAILVELSDLNFNVLFEYGYSIGLRKKIHPIVGADFNFKNVERFLQPLLGIGFGTYEKNKMAKKLEKKRFWEKSRPKAIYDFYDNHILSDDYKVEANSILYIRNVDDPRISEEVEKELSRSSANIIVDDAQEENYNLIWYAKQIKRSFAVIIDLGMSHEKENMKHFLKSAFISGICIATGRRTLILHSIHAPKKPSDIITLIKEYDSAKSASRKVHSFLNEHANQISMINSYLSTLHKDQKTIFDEIDLGEHVAINDRAFIEKCYVETPEFKSLHKYGYKMIIGRKGTGKSAAFFHFKDKNNKKNEMVIHQLFDKYNLNDLYGITEEFESIEDKNKIATAFWKYVILLIVARKIRQEIDDTLPGIIPEEINERFITFFDSSGFDIYEKSITEHLVDLLNDIKSSGFTTIKEIQKKLYHKTIAALKEEIITYLKKTEKTLFLNIDGLDSNLDIHKNKRIISLILFNLHEVCSNLFAQLTNQYSINLFLRTDLYFAFKDKITEKDKITKLFFSWRPEYLIQIINNRLNENGISHIADLLQDSFSIDKLMLKIQTYVYDRPRDYVFLFNNLIQIAQTLKKEKIDSKVFNDALEYYSLHVNESLEAEFLSLQYDISYGEFLTNLKGVKTDKNRIRVKKFLDLLIQMGLDRGAIQEFLLFLLQIKLVELHQDHKPIEWNKLSNPKLKLSQILKTSHKRYFYFPQIMQKIIEELF